TQAFFWAPGSSHTIATTLPQSGGVSTRYIWNSWSGGGTISHSIAPTKNTTYTAKFSKQYFLTMNAQKGGAVTPQSGWKPSGTTVSITATSTNNASVSYTFSGWTGSGNGSYSGTNNPASITMSGPIIETAAFTQKPVQVTVQANMAGVSFMVDGSTYTAAHMFAWQPGSSHWIATTSPQSRSDPMARAIGSLRPRRRAVARGLVTCGVAGLGAERSHTLSHLPQTRPTQRSSRRNIT